MLHAGLAMAHARILGAVWGMEYGGELEYLRTYVRHLRKKLEDDPAEPKYLLTDACYGYRFADFTVAAKGEPGRTRGLTGLQRGGSTRWFPPAPFQGE